MWLEETLPVHAVVAAGRVPPIVRRSARVGDRGYIEHPRGRSHDTLARLARPCHRRRRLDRVRAGAFSRALRRCGSATAFEAGGVPFIHLPRGGCCAIPGGSRRPDPRGLRAPLRRGGMARRPWGKASVIMLALGAFLLLPQESFPLLVGWLFYFAGMLALAITSLRTGVIPRSAAWMLIGAAILLFFFNTEDDRALLAIAPGLAWATLGARGLMSAARRSSVPTPDRKSTRL